MPEVAPPTDAREAEIAPAVEHHAKINSGIWKREVVKKSTFAPLFQKVTISGKKIKNVTAKTHDIQEDAQRA